MNKRKCTAFGKIMLIILVITAIITGAVAVSYKSVLKVLYPLKYTEIIDRNCKTYNLEPALMYAVIKCESGFDVSAKSNVGARGLTQILPETFEWLQTKTGENLKEEDLYDEEISVKYGAKMLRILLDTFHDTKTAVAAYHAGMGIVSKWIDNPEYSSDGKTLDVIPYDDTALYVKRVMRARNIYNNLYDLQ